MVVGGGYIGVEMAEAIIRRGLAATLITRSEVMSSLDPDMSTRISAGARQIEIARTGLSTAEAAAAGLTVSSLVTEGRTASGYMPEASPIATKVLAEQGSRRLLGVQIVGGQGAAKRIDTAAAALWGGMTVDDLAGMDLAYAPPFATVWEAVQLAARRLADRL